MQKPTHINRKPLYAAVVGGVFAISASSAVIADGINPAAQQNPLLLAATCNPCNPCAAKKCNPCNPCAAKAYNPCNPCAAKNPCNPCAAKNPCNPCNPCAAKNPCKTT
ncbi:MAG: hypothetical protein GTO67_10690 [Gammaproteobacteria bacterium]|nr:hypothetical protein [Gammaproteobacteria bacterium]NIM74170.1 hypothetical protein [Gammaproteobacteria bacterium]NIN39081.1 hypothetical protein [Gammaproteobacteria bacterium]NIO25947.1 hypothetical protein [Gammaproteobacteria bacterium]NIO66577.1 hypothetical protein [Gammaproteobacteria bacterium]